MRQPDRTTLLMNCDNAAALELPIISHLQIRLTLDGAACVWTGTGFVTAADAALEGAADSAPYLHAVLPRLAAKHRDLLLALGVCRYVAYGDCTWLETVVSSVCTMMGCILISEHCK